MTADSILLGHFHVLAASEEFMRDSVPGLLKENQGLLKELFLAALASPGHRARLEAALARESAPRVPTFVVCPGTDRVTLAEYKKADKEGKESVERLLLDRGYTRK